MILLALGTIMLSCKSTLYTADRPVLPVTIDGKPGEWSLPLRYSDSKTGLQYTMASDSSKLFICIRATEQNTMMQIINGGLDLWIAPDGSGNETMEIQFPLAMQQERKQAPNMTRQKPGAEKPGEMMMKMFNESEHSIILKGFGKGVDGNFVNSESKLIQASAGMDSRSGLFIEYSIPLQLIKQKQSAKNPDANIVGIQIETYDFALLSGRPSGQQGPPSGGQMGGAGGGGQMGSGGGQMGDGGSMGPGGGSGPRPDDAGSSDNELKGGSIKFRIKY
ncbi:MAG: hypothetical protein IPH88_12215 [Bacteroidales bacterium]|nr:hypothetical protein [Bacteroidales bacterium]